MLFALLPAAGHSTRMGRPKLSLPLGDRTVIEQVIFNIKRAGIDRILVVVGPHVPELVPLAESAGAIALPLDEPTPDMRSTVELGLTWIEANWQPADDDAFLLVPADHPVLDVDVIRQLIDPRQADDLVDRGLPLRYPRQAGGYMVRIPTFNGTRGHPTLIGWRHVAGIRALARDAGLNSYLRAHPDQVEEVPVESETILFDMDTPADYERMCRLHFSEP